MTDEDDLRCDGDGEPASRTGRERDRDHTSPAYPPIIRWFHPGTDATHDDRVRAAAKMIPVLLALIVTVGGITFVAASSLYQYLLVLIVGYLNLPQLVSYITLLALFGLLMYALAGETTEENVPLQRIAGVVSGLLMVCIPLILLFVGVLQPPGSVRAVLSPLVLIGSGVIVTAWNVMRYRQQDTGIRDIDVPL